MCLGKRGLLEVIERILNFILWFKFQVAAEGGGGGGFNETGPTALLPVIVFQFKSCNWPRSCRHDFTSTFFHGHLL